MNPTLTQQDFERLEIYDPRLEIIDNPLYFLPLKGVEAGMRRWAGTYVNPNSVKLEDFKYGAYKVTTSGPYVYQDQNIVFVHKQSGRVHVAATFTIMPTMDFYGIVAELSRLAAGV